MKKDLNKFISNKIALRKNNYFALIIGNSPSKGARSPILWNKAYKFFKKKTRMYPADVTENKLKSLCEYLKFNKYFIGSSVTVPFKEKVISYLDTIDKNALAIGSVNTIIKKKNKLHGINTDYHGSLYSLKKIPIKKKKQRILVIGCGGAGKACIVSIINYFKDSQILVFNRNKKKLMTFIRRLKIKNKNSLKHLSSLKDFKKIKKIDLIVNTTSIGFDSWIKQKKYINLKEYSPVSLVKFKEIKSKSIDKFKVKNKEKINRNILETFNFLKSFKNLSIFDIIYQPNTTTLMKIGSLLGFRVYNGLTMNFVQAVEAFKIVNNKKNINQVMKGMNYGK